MKIQIELTQDRIPSDFGVSEEWRGKAGAFVEFSGLVRDEEKGRNIAALDYEAYSTMALKSMRSILESLAIPYPCMEVRVMHRVGTVPVSEAAIRIAIWGRHRTEAFGLLATFMDRLKTEVPIWKLAPTSPEPQAPEEMLKLVSMEATPEETA